MRRLHHLALASGVACLAAAADAGGAPLPETSEQTQPEQPQPDAEKTGKKVVIVWCQPGHETLSIGQLAAMTAEAAEILRGAGRARLASDAEVKAAEAAKAEITDLSGI